jgi:glutamyl-tRNA synthetase
MRNYLLRLGWGHGDAEIISTEQAIEWFDLGGIGKSPSRFDMTKLLNLNAHYLRERDAASLVELIKPIMEKTQGVVVNAEIAQRLEQGMDGLKQRAKDLNELADGAMVYAKARPLTFDEKAKKQLTPETIATLRELHDQLVGVETWDKETVETAIKAFAESKELKIGKILQPLRAALTGTTVSPSMFEVMVIFGKDEALARLQDCLS